MKYANSSTSSWSLVQAARAVVLFRGEVVVDARDWSSGQPLMTALVRRAVGAVLGREVVDDLAVDAAGRGDAHLVQVGVTREVAPRSRGRPSSRSGRRVFCPRANPPLGSWHASYTIDVAADRRRLSRRDALRIVPSGISSTRPSPNGRRGHAAREDRRARRGFTLSVPELQLRPGPALKPPMPNSWRNEPPVLARPLNTPLVSVP